MQTPLAYFITFRTYGTWLHGDSRGSVDGIKNLYGSEFVDPSAGRQEIMSNLMTGPAVTLSTSERKLVNTTLVEVCSTRGWSLVVLNVRTNHVHVVLSCPDTPEKAMNDLKAWATRRLREAGLRKSSEKIWSRHGSTKYIWNEQQLVAACGYVTDSQESKE